MKLFFPLFAYPSLLAPLVLCLSVSVNAGIKDDLGFTSLSSLLGAGLPDGSGITVFQIEANDSEGDWIADAADSQFVGKSIVDFSSPVSVSTSFHATSVGRIFYGNGSSLSPGINDIAAYSVIGWLLDELNIDTGFPIESNRRIANHSWVSSGLTDGGGNFSASLTSSALRLSDWYSSIDEVMQVFGTNNNNSFSNSASRVLMATAYNGLVVGVSDYTHAENVVALDSIYVAGRVGIDVVVPTSTTSSAAAYGSAASALLMSAAQSNPSWSESSTSNRLGTSIDNAERIETLKAVLMAGADRSTTNTTTIGDIVGYRAEDSDKTDNGLDWRYGAGQLNILNSYNILAAGEKSSLEDGGGNSVGFTGFDHDSEFGGASGSNDIATYDLGTTTSAQKLAVSLVWNLDVIGIVDPPGPSKYFDETATVYDIDLELVNMSAGGIVVATSASLIDNTENLWLTLSENTHYQLRIKKGVSQSDFNWDYSIAWFGVEFTSNPADMNVPLPVWIYFVLVVCLVCIAKHKK